MFLVYQKKYSWISLSFTNLINAIAWYLLVKSVESSTWLKKAYHRKPLHVICHQYAKFSFQSLVLHLVLEFFHYVFTCWHDYFLTQIVTFPLLHNNICYEITCFLALFVFLLTVILLTKAFLSLFYDSNNCLRSSEFLFVMWLWFVVMHLLNFVGNFASLVSFFTTDEAQQNRTIWIIGPCKTHW